MRRLTLAAGLAGGLAAGLGPGAAGAQQHRHPPAASEEEEPITPIPPLTDEDRAAAFPEVEPHPPPDAAIHSFVLVDRLEWSGSGPGGGLAWDSEGWTGTDLHRMRFRTGGEFETADDGRGELELLYGRAVAPFWDVVAGARQDFKPGPAGSWLAFGIAGLAPYWFEVEATAYVGTGGRFAVRIEAEYELLITNRLVLEPSIELDLRRGGGTGSLDGGLRMRYELRREFAPYLGIEWGRPIGDRTDPADAGLRLVTGLRVWF